MDVNRANSSVEKDIGRKYYETIVKEVDDKYIPAGAIKILIKKIKKETNNCESIGVFAPLFNGKSMVAKKLCHDMFAENNFSSDTITMPIYFKCNKYDYDSDMKNAILCLTESVLDFISNTRLYIDFEDKRKLKQIFESLKEYFDEKIEEISIDLLNGILTKVDSGILNTLVDVIKKLKKDVKSLDEYIKPLKDNLENFNEAMTIVIFLMALNQAKVFSKEDYKNKKIQLVLILDDIDRANPQYALNMIQTIRLLNRLINDINAQKGDKEKQLFKFVVFGDFEYLLNIHAGLYSKNVNLQNYYSQFFDRIIPMPIASKEQFLEDILSGTKIISNVASIYKKEIEKKKRIDSLKAVMKRANEEHNINLHGMKRTITEFDQLIFTDPFMMCRKENFWFLFLFYNLLVLKNTDIAFFDNVLYDSTVNFKKVNSKKNSFVDNEFINNDFLISTDYSDKSKDYTLDSSISLITSKIPAFKNGFYIRVKDNIIQNETFNVDEFVMDDTKEKTEWYFGMRSIDFAKIHSINSKSSNIKSIILFFKYTEIEEYDLESRLSKMSFNEYLCYRLFSIDSF